MANSCHDVHEYEVESAKPHYVLVVVDIPPVRLLISCPHDVGSIYVRLTVLIGVADFAYSHCFTVGGLDVEKSVLVDFDSHVCQFL